MLRLLRGNKGFKSLLWTWMLSALSLGAQSEPIDSISVQEIGRRAAENASLLKAQSEEVLSSKLDAEGAGLLPNPSLAVQVGSLNSGGTFGPTVETTLTQVFPFPRKRGTQERLKQIEAKLVESSVQQAKVLVQHDATLRAFRWVVLDEETKHFRERQRRFRLIRDYLRNRPLAAPAAKAESYLIEGQIELLEKEFVELQQEKDAIQLELQYLLQTPHLIVPQADWINPKTLPEKTALNAEVASSREMQRKQLQVQHAEQVLERANLQPFPDISLGAGYRNEAVSPANHFFYGAIGVVIPLFDRGQYAGPAARARLEAERAREGILRAKVTQEIAVAWMRLSSAKAIAATFELSRISSIDKRFEEVEREFRKGRVTTSILLQTDSQLHDSVAAIYDAQLTLAQRLSELKSLFGEPLTWE